MRSPLLVFGAVSSPLLQSLCMWEMLSLLSMWGRSVIIVMMQGRQMDQARLKRIWP